MMVGSQAFRDLVAEYKAAIDKFNLDEKDLSRLEFAANTVTGSSVMDIGVGQCLPLNFLARTKNFDRLVAMDIKPHSQLRLDPGVEFVQESITSDLSGYGKFDTVICMEVIEHIEPQYNDVMLANLRGLAAERLVVTVPYDEPEPVWWHDKPGGHRQKFDDEKLRKLFPQALATRFPRHGVDWIFMAEDRRLGVSGFEEVDRDDFLSRLSAASGR